LSGRRADRQEQAVQFRHKEGCSRSGNRRNTGDASISVPFRVEHIDDAVAATCVDAVALGIDEEIVGVAADGRVPYQRAIRHREYAEDRWTAENGEDRPGGGMERHWE